MRVQKATRWSAISWRSSSSFNFCSTLLGRHPLALRKAEPTVTLLSTRSNSGKHLASATRSQHATPAGALTKVERDEGGSQRYARTGADEGAPRRARQLCLG